MKKLGSIFRWNLPLLLACMILGQTKAIYCEAENTQILRTPASIKHFLIRIKKCEYRCELKWIFMYNKTYVWSFRRYNLWKYFHGLVAYKHVMIRDIVIVQD